MTYTVTVTSQGQISIPMPIRRALKLDRNRKAIVRQEGNQIVIKPVPDIMDLAGIFKSDKKFTREQEKAAFEEYLANRSKWKDI